jgi:cytochrome c2
MNSTRIWIGVLAALGTAGFANAQDSALAEGEKLYTAQCQICHGRVDHQASESAPGRVRLAMNQVAGSTLSDVSPRLVPEAGAPERVAVAMPFGPNLRGIVGRPAGTVEGYSYSAALTKSLKGMEWNEAALNVWITDPQAWVPGVFMFYKQRDAEVRRKIILYLKANS